MSGIVTEPDTGLIFAELSHEWGHYTPPTPGFRDIQVFRVATHATHGVLTQRIVTAMHHGIGLGNGPDPVRRRRIHRLMSEPEGRGSAWTDERGTSEEGRRCLGAPRRRAEDSA